MRQRPHKTIADYVRSAEKLAKRVPQDLDSVIALCLVKGMADEAKKADISYVIHSKPKITFREVVEVIKAKHQVIGRPDPFATTYLGGGKHGYGKAGTAGTMEDTRIPYVTPGHGAAQGLATSPLQIAAAAAAHSIPSYRITRNPSQVIPRNNQNSERNANNNNGGEQPTATGVSEEQLFAMMDRYLQARRGNPGMAAGPGETGFRQPAPPTPQVTLPARGVLNTQVPQTGGRGQTTGNAPSIRITCFACGRRGHYANSCQYPPLSPDEQEQLRENARVHRLQQAGLVPTGTGHAGFAGQVAVDTGRTENTETWRDESPRITEIQEEHGVMRGGANTANANLGQQGPTETTGHASARQSSLGVACAVLSRLPPVMNVLQKIMAEKRMRMETDNGSAEGELPRPMKTRRRAFMEQLEGDGGERDGERGVREDRMGNDESKESEPRREGHVPLQTPETKEERRDTRRTSPINLMKGQEPYSIERALTSIQPEITFPQLLDVSPRLRRELAILLRSSQPRTRRKKEPETGGGPTVNSAGGPLRMTEAAEDAEVDCLYITASSNGTKIPNVLVDGGAMIELVSEELVARLNFNKHEVKDLGIRLADDSLVRLKHYVWIDLEVEGVMARIRAYIMPVKETYQILLSRRWLKRMRGVEDHSDNTLTIQGVDGIPRKVKGRPAPPADFEIIPATDQSPMDTSRLDADGDADDAIDDLLLELDRMDGLDYEAGKGERRR